MDAFHYEKVGLQRMDSIPLFPMDDTSMEAAAKRSTYVAKKRSRIISDDCGIMNLKIRCFQCDLYIMRHVKNILNVQPSYSAPEGCSYFDALRLP